MQSHFLNFREGRIHYLQFGTGPELLFALHGFADRARMFAMMEPALGKRYTVVAIDWPFHGQTQWTGVTFSKTELLEIIQKLAAQLGKTRFSLLAYRFGARLAQAMLPELALQLNKLYLLAPDGVNTKGMSMATHTPMWLRRVSFRILRRPGWFITLLGWGRRIHVVPAMIHHFLSNNLVRPERFQRTFGCWLAMDSFYLGRRKIRAILQETGLPTEIYVGTQDKVVTSAAWQQMVVGLPNVRLHLLEEGHRLVGESLVEAMIKNQVQTGLSS
ncbi:MAG: alpha/beta hydrolase [Saprospiraceae bacterium]